MCCLLPLGCGQPDRSAERADFRFISASAHHHLDPQKASWLHDIRIIDCLFEPLVRLRPNDHHLEPGVADRWHVSEDGRTYTFHLRPNARWNNGDPVTAHDFIYAWRRAVLPDSAADYTQLLFCIRGAEAFFHWRAKQLRTYQASPEQHSQEAADRLWRQALARFDQTVGLKTPPPPDPRNTPVPPDSDLTLVVELARPTPYFLELCAFATLMPVHAASVGCSTRIDPDTGMLTPATPWTHPPHLIGNGPYRLQQWKFKQHLLLTTNEHYWDRSSMGNHSILEQVVDNPQTALLAYTNGQTDWLADLPTTGSLAGDLVQSDRPDVHVASAAGTYFYNFNCRPRLSDGSTNPLADPRLRRALSMAIDRSAIVNHVTRLGPGGQPVAHTFVPPGVLPGYAPPTQAGARFDPDTARGLLTAAGYPQGLGLVGLSILYNTEGGHELIAQQIKHNWQTLLGVSVQLEAADSQHFSDRLKNQDYTICRAGWFGDYRDPTTFLDKFLTANGNNDCAWSDPRFDRLLRDASMMTQPRRRMEMLQRAEAIMLQAQPIAPIYHYVNLWLYDPDRVQGLAINPWNTRRLDRVRVVR